MTDLYTRAEIKVLAYKDTADFLALVALIDEIEDEEASELDFHQEAA
jgi:hypothetical protein